MSISIPYFYKLTVYDTFWEGEMIIDGKMYRANSSQAKDYGETVLYNEHVQIWAIKHYMTPEALLLLLKGETLC